MAISQKQFARLMNSMAVVSITPIQQPLTSVEREEWKRNHDIDSQLDRYNDECGAVKTYSLAELHANA